MPVPEPNAPRTRPAAPSSLGEAELRGATSRPLLDGYQLHDVLAESGVAIVYLATDLALKMPVAIKEYLPVRHARRHSASLVVPMPGDAAIFDRGLHAFLDESRILARCDDPSLVRVVRLFEANGTAYRVMPYLDGERLADVRARRRTPFDEATLQTLLDRLLRAVQAYHRVGGVHGRVTPDNVLLLANDRPLLLGPGSVSAALDAARAAATGRAVPPPPDAATGPWSDVHQVARIGRFCITGRWSEDDADDEDVATVQAASLLAARDPRAPEAPVPTEVAHDDGTPTVPDAPAVPDGHVGLGSIEPSGADAAAHAHAMGRAPDVVPEDDAFARTPMDPAIPPRESTGTPTPEERSREPQETTPEREPFSAAADGTREALEGADPAPWRLRARDQRRHALRLWIAGGVALAIVAAVGFAWWANQQPVRIEGWNAGSARGADEQPIGGPADRAPPAALEAVPATKPPAEAAAPVAVAPTGSADPSAATAEPSSPREPSPSQASPSPLPESPPRSRDVTPADVLEAPPPAPPLPAQRPAPSTAPSARASTRAAPERPSPASPREACSGRTTQFSLYRCMRTQCEQARWQGHAQCERLRRTDEVS